MKLLLRSSLMVLILFAIFSAFSGNFGQAFGSVGKPPQSPCMPSPTRGATAVCVK